MPEMPEISSKNLETSITKKSEKLLLVDKIKEKVELGLSHFGEKKFDKLYNKIPPGENAGIINALNETQKKYLDILASFRGELSTKPEEVGKKVNQESLYEKCGIFSNELKRCLNQVGLNTKKVINSKHIHLKASESNEDIAIDPVIGEYLEGHNNIFVGTYSQLKELILQYAREGKLSYLTDDKHEKIKVPPNKADNFFQTHWQNNLNNSHM